MKLFEQIERTKAEMKRIKPRSIRMMELNLRLRELMLQQLRYENRMKRRNAA